MNASHEQASRSLAEFLQEFDVPTSIQDTTCSVTFQGDIPPPDQTKSQKINLTLIGIIPCTANAFVAARIFEARGGRGQTITSDLRRGHCYIDPDIGMTPSINGQEITVDVVAGNPFLFNIYETADGKFVNLSAVYVDLVYQWTALLGCSLEEEDVRHKVKQWTSYDLEAACAEAGMPMAVCQTEAAWRQHAHGSVLAHLPWVPTQRLNNHLDSLPSHLTLPPNPLRPLSGLRVLCVTHAIAGPSAGRTLAEHGASVLQVMFTHGFEHSFVYTYANLGTASTRLNLHNPRDRARLQTLVRDAHVWIDSYRPEAIDKFGFADEQLRELNPNLIVTRVRCYGTQGPWAGKPGFDMQGSASSGLMALMGEGQGDGRPQWPPGMVINDYTTGYAAALAIQSIVLKRLDRRADPKDGWLVSPSLTGTAMGILRHFKASKVALESEAESLPPLTIEEMTGLGYLKTLRPLPEMSVTPIRYEHGLLHPMGSDLPVFPGFDDGYTVHNSKPLLKEEVMHSLVSSSKAKLERLRRIGEAWRQKTEKMSANL